MKKKKGQLQRKGIAVVLTTALLAALLAGCGSAEEGDAKTPAYEEPAEAAEAPASDDEEYYYEPEYETAAPAEQSAADSAGALMN